MSNYSGMTCEQLAAALAKATDPADKAAIQAAQKAKGCIPQTNDGGGSHPTPPDD